VAAPHAPEEGVVFAPSRCHKISQNASAIEALFVTLYWWRTPSHRCTSFSNWMPPTIRCTGIRYYDCYCYLTLYIFCGRHLLAVKLLRSNIDVSAGACEEVAGIMA
jgi:predicted NAD-dependent protein-ADP-ribosyltransferase YbiA (DUF1768 family)